MTSLFGAAKSAWAANKAEEKTKRTKTSPADVVMWSGCKDNQTVSIFGQRSHKKTRELTTYRARILRKMVRPLAPCPTYVSFLAFPCNIQIIELTLNLRHLSPLSTNDLIRATKSCSSRFEMR